MSIKAMNEVIEELIKLKKINKLEIVQVLFKIENGKPQPYCLDIITKNGTEYNFESDEIEESWTNLLGLANNAMGDERAIIETKGCNKVTIKTS